MPNNNYIGKVGLIERLINKRESVIIVVPLLTIFTQLKIMFLRVTLSMYVKHVRISSMDIILL